MMPTSLRQNLKVKIPEHEGREKFPYVDTLGNITIGIGYNLTARGVTDAWIDQEFDNDIDYFYNQLTIDYPWYQELTEARQLVLIDMAFMGYKKLQQFTNMFEAINRKDFKTAAEEILNSKWAKEVKERRAQDDYQMMLIGEFA